MKQFLLAVSASEGLYATYLWRRAKIPKAAVLGPVWGIPPKKRRGKVISPSGFPTSTAGVFWGEDLGLDCGRVVAQSLHW